MTKKIRLIIFTTSYYPFVGGAEIAVQEVGRRLAGRFDICIVTSRFSRKLPKHEARPEGNVIRVGMGSRFDKWLLPLLGCFVGLRQIRRGQTVLWGMDIGQGSGAALLCKVLERRCPFVLTIEYGYGDARLARGRFGAIGIALRWMLACADEVTVISSYLEDVATAYGYRGSCALIHNGVDTDLFGRGASEKQKDLDAPTIITVSRLVEKNGVDTLIRAIGMVKKKTGVARCHILGDGPERPRLEQLARNLGLQNEIKFFGNVPYEKLPVFLHEATVFVRLSRSEGMGNSFVEALAAGIPVIGTEVGGIPDIITDGATGLFAKVDDPDDAAEKIIRLLQDPGLGRSIVENGKKMLHERFLWDSIAKKYEEIFERSLLRRRHILIATGLFPPEIGGPATYSKLLQDELPKFGFAVTVVPFRAVRHLPKLVRHGAYFWRVFREGAHVDIIFAQDPVSVGLPAALAALLLRKKFMLKIVGDYAWEQGSQRFSVSDQLDEFLKKKYGWKVELLRRLQAWSAARADCIVVPSEYLRSVVAQWGITPNRISVIYNAFDPPYQTLSKDEARKKLGLAGIVLISIGRLVPWKGFDALIKLVKKLQIDIPDIRLMIIGDGPERERLAQKIREHDLGKVIALAGNRSHEDVVTALTAGDVFILNTGYEGFSHTLLEAMAMGIPICTTRAGGNEELVRDQENGIFFERDNIDQMRAAVMRIVQDHDFAHMLAERAREKAGSFSTQRMLGETVALLKSI